MSLEVFGLGVTSQSATRTDLAADYGATRYWKGNKYKLFQAGAAIGAKTICMFSAIDGTSGQTATIDGTVGETVVVTTGTAVDVVCANATGSAITSGNYFWGLVEGYAVLTGDGSVASGEAIMPAAAGAVDTYVEGSSGIGNTCCGRALEADGASTYPVTCFFMAAPNHNTNA